MKRETGNKMLVRLCRRLTANDQRLRQSMTKSGSEYRKLRGWFVKKEATALHFIKAQVPPLHDMVGGRQRVGIHFYLQRLLLNQ